jgi:hypothetical protein
MQLEPKIQDPWGVALSILVNTIISAAGAPVGPVIAALLIGFAVAWLLCHQGEAGE